MSAARLAHLMEAFRQMGRDVQASPKHAFNNRASAASPEVLTDKLHGRRYGLAVSFEVTEHIPAWKADRYIALLCSLSTVIVRSAAIPRSGGIDLLTNSRIPGKHADKRYSFDQASSAKLARSGSPPVSFIGTQTALG